MQSSDDPAASGWKRFAVEGGFESLVGPLWHRRAGDTRRFAFRAERRHANPNGVIHGGMLMTLADYALGAIVWEAIGRKPCATVSFHADFLSATHPGDWVEGDSAITRQGRSLVFVRGEFRVGDRPVLAADGIWKVLGAT